MIFREAKTDDIPQMQIVRNSVKENMLSNPALIPHGEYIEYMNNRGKGWVCEMAGRIAGFAIADLKDNNIWALFILPECENKGIGKKLHSMMLNWYFEQTSVTVWLGTAPATRAAEFYRRQGWKQVGMHGAELKFEMTKTEWLKLRSA